MKYYLYPIDSNKVPPYSFAVAGLYTEDGKYILAKDLELSPGAEINIIWDWGKYQIVVSDARVTDKGLVITAEDSREPTLLPSVHLRGYEKLSPETLEALGHMVEAAAKAMKEGKIGKASGAAANSKL